jgi:hypothetical protein
MGLRSRSIRMRVFLLILIPIVSLGALYGFAAQVTASAALSLARSKAVRMELAAPTTLLQDQLAAERHLALLYLASPAPALQAALDQQESSTDRAVRAFERSAAPGAIRPSALCAPNCRSSPACATTWRPSPSAGHRWSTPTAA